MRYMMIYRTKEDPKGPTPPSPQEMADMGKFIEEMRNAGVLISTGGLGHSSSGVRVRRTGEKVTVTDGPFTESKELIGGFAVVEAKSMDEVVGLAKRFLKFAGDGESEIRAMFEG